MSRLVLSKKTLNFSSPIFLANNNVPILGEFNYLLGDSGYKNEWIDYNLIKNGNSTLQETFGMDIRTNTYPKYMNHYHISYIPRVLSYNTV